MSITSAISVIKDHCQRKTRITYIA
ncbi:hypothetical protein Nmel_011874 [Mimus melanotis]